jgi:hypothetical protein
MADADWVKYKQIRGKRLPEVVELLGASYRLGAMLKQDFYAATGLYEREETDAVESQGSGPPRQVLLKVYHVDPLGIIPLAFMGRLLCRREAGFLKQLDGVEGVPRLLALHGPSGLVREFAPGCNLRQYSRSGGQVDAEFFPKLRAILDEVHARGLSHNDLSKPENLLVTPEGAPVLIDFQIATSIATRGGPLVRALSLWLIRYMQGVDGYHLAKQYSRRRPMDFTPDERAAMERKGWLITAHGWLRRPYRAVRHLVLRNFLMADAAPTQARAAVPAPHLLDRTASKISPAPGPARIGVAEERPTG